MQAQNTLAIPENVPPPLELLQMADRMLDFAGDVCRGTAGNR
jgi:hypothetical protein